MFDTSAVGPAFHSKMRSWRRQLLVRFAVIVMLVIAAPLLAGLAQRYVSPDVVHTRFVRATIGSWAETYIASIAILFVLIELVSSVMMRLGKKMNRQILRSKSLLKALCARAGITSPIRIIQFEQDGMINAGAMRSFRVGRTIILIGDLSKLQDEELEAVLAHELGHLVMGDSFVGHVIKSLLFAVRVLNFVTLVSLVWSLWYRDFDLTWFLLVAYLTTFIAARVARLVALSHSRICEYRADAIAVALTSADHRKYLLSAIKKVREVGLLVMLKKSERIEIDWNKTHPSLKNRARALGFLWKKVASVS